MACANPELINALRRTAQRLASDISYQWGHMGMCNCGHLAQSITGLREADIHSSALIREGDWEQQANDYCPASGNLIDVILAAMFDLGLTRADIRNLEKLADLDVLRRAGRHLRFNNREDVVLYMRTWADLLEEECGTGTLAGAARTRVSVPQEQEQVCGTGTPAGAARTRVSVPQ